MADCTSPERKHLYPANWKTEIVPMIRARSEDCCDVCGVLNGAMIQRGTRDSNPHWWKYENSSLLIYNIKGKPALAEGCEITWQNPIRIVLTVAHLNHDETDNRPENLAHLCQLHHNRHDAKRRAANAKARRERPVNKTDGQTPIVGPSDDPTI